MVPREGGTVTLGANTANALGQVTCGAFTGTIDFSSYTVYCTIFNGSGTGARTFDFNTSTIELSGTGTIFTCATTTNLTINGTSAGATIKKVANSSTACTIVASLAFKWPKLWVAAGSATITLTGCGLAGLDWTGATGTFTATSSFVLRGPMTLVSGMTSPSFTSPILIFGDPGTDGTYDITCAGKTFANPIQINSTSTARIFRFVDNCTTSSTLTLGNGSTGAGMEIAASVTVKCTTFTCTTGSGTVAMIWGSSSILELSGTGTIFAANNCTITATTPENGTLKKSANSSTACTISGNSQPLPIIAVTAGTAAITLTNITCAGINWTGSGTWASASNAISVSGDFKLNAGMTMSANDPITFNATTTGRKITMGGKAFGSGAAVTFDGVGGEWTLQDNFNVIFNSITLTNGTLITNGKNVVTLSYTLTGGALTLGASQIDATGTGTVWNLTGTSVSAGTSVIVLSDASASSKTFAGGGATYNNIKLSGAGTGAFIIDGSNTFNKFEAITPPHTITFTSGTTQYISDWAVSGTAGNFMTINASSVGTPATLSKASGVVSSDYLDLTDNTATGGATWNSGANSVKHANVTGWDVVTASGSITRMLFGLGM